MNTKKTRRERIVEALVDPEVSPEVVAALQAKADGIPAARVVPSSYSKARNAPDTRCGTAEQSHERLRFRPTQRGRTMPDTALVTRGRPSLASCLTTLHFERDDEDELRRVGISKERRIDPQVQAGLLVDRGGFRLEVHLFEGNMSVAGDKRTAGLAYLSSVSRAGRDDQKPKGECWPAPGPCWAG